MMPSPEIDFFWDEKRVQRAKTAELTPLRLDKENQSAIFASGKGDNFHDCSMKEGCNCQDFYIVNASLQAERTYACKHLIRLAYELGMIQMLDVVEDYESAKIKMNNTSLLNFGESTSLKNALAVGRTITVLLEEGYIREMNNDLSYTMSTFPFLIEKNETKRTTKYSLSSTYRKTAKAYLTKLGNNFGDVISRHILDLPAEFITMLSDMAESDYKGL